MVNIGELKFLVNQQIRDGVEARKRSEKAENEAKLRSEEADRRHDESQQKVVNQLEEIGRLRAAAAAVAPADGVAAPAHGPVLDEAAQLQAAAAARAEKISKIQINLRKSNKVREFKDSSEANVKEWLTKFDTELNTQENGWYSG